MVYPIYNFICNLFRVMSSSFILSITKYLCVEKLLALNFVLQEVYEVYCDD